MEPLIASEGQELVADAPDWQSMETEPWSNLDVAF